MAVEISLGVIGNGRNAKSNSLWRKGQLSVTSSDAHFKEDEDRNHLIVEHVLLCIERCV